MMKSINTTFKIIAINENNFPTFNDRPVTSVRLLPK